MIPSWEHYGHCERCGAPTGGPCRRRLRYGGWMFLELPHPGRPYV